jgi:hypothetical protein
MRTALPRPGTLFAASTTRRLAYAACVLAPLWALVLWAIHD